MTDYYKQSMIVRWIDMRDDAQSQLDALMGDCPEICQELERQIFYLNDKIDCVQCGL